MTNIVHAKQQIRRPIGFEEYVYVLPIRRNFVLIGIKHVPIGVEIQLMNKLVQSVNGEFVIMVEKAYKLASSAGQRLVRRSCDTLVFLQEARTNPRILGRKLFDQGPKLWS